MVEVNTPNSPIGFKPAFAGLCADWEDTTLMRFGERMWQQARERLSKEDQADHELLQDAITAYIEKLYAPTTMSKRVTAERIAVFALTWAVHAFQKLMTTHTYAAALMCSDPSKDVLKDLEIPYLGFMVHVPNGLLTFVSEDGTQIDYTRILVTGRAGFGGHAFMTVYDPAAPPSSTGRTFTVGADTLADLLFDDAREWVGVEDQRIESPTKETRVTRLAKRLVAGLLLAMQHQDNFKSRNVPTRTNRERGVKEPAHRITIIGRPLKIDCRPHVRDYLSGKRHAPPSVQVIVRGHYKRQVIGIGRLGRKVIWVQPYWRGPEDAPILTRPKLLTGTRP